MLDIKFVRENKELVKENIKKKFQDEKLPLVDEVIELDQKNRELKQQGDMLRSKRNESSGNIGKLMRDKKIDEANALKDEVKKINEQLVEIEQEEEEVSKKIYEKMLIIPQMIDPSVPVGKDDSENVEIEIMQIFAIN